MQGPDRRLHWGVAVLLAAALAGVLALGGGAPARASGASGCPNADKTLDYNCPVGPTYLMPGLTDVTGWDQPAHYENIFTADLNGDGTDELVVRGVAGVEVYRFDDASGQWSQVSVNPILPDSAGWDQPRYYRTIQLVDAEGSRPAQLFARSPAGIVVYDYQPGTTPDTGAWTQVTTSGPMSDKDCFSNGKCWGDDPGYYSTIQVGDLGTLTDLVGRGADGLVAYVWNGSGWDKSATLSDLSDANGWNKPEYYSSIRIWSNGEILLARAPDGMRVYQLSLGPPATWQKVGTGGPFADTACFANGKCWNSGPEYYSTIQLAPNPGSGNPLVLGRGGDGIEYYRGSPTQNNGPWVWEPLTDKPASIGAPFSDAAGFDKPEYYRTIHSADINGQGALELIGRTSTGMVAYRFMNPGGGTGHWSAPISSGQPALEDDPWAKKPGYYETIKTAVLKDSPPAPTVGLLARGPYGIRTWRFDASTSTWTRYKPYGNFPGLDSQAFQALNTFLGITNGSVRSVYTDPSSNPTPDQLSGYQNAISNLCTGELSASPPAFKTCTPPASAPPGVTSATWTAVSNQIIAELYWARQVLDYYGTVEGINTQLFLDQDSEFPSVGDELKLAEASQVVASVDYLALIEGVLDTLAVIPEVGDVFGVTAGALGIIDAATSTGSGTEPSEFDHKFSEMQTHIAKIRQEAQDAITFHRHFVLGDYGLLSAVGHLVASQTWRLDTQAALSAGRQGFTLWAYHGLLPALWDQWDVHGCAPLQQDVCDPPQNGKGMQSYTTHSDGSTDFNGLVPRQTPCVAQFTFHCRFTSLEAQGYTNALNTLRDPVTSACTYDPNAQTSWEYGKCTLGLTWDQLNAKTSIGFAVWPFRFFTCTQNGIDNSECVRNQPTSIVAGSAKNRPGAHDNAALSIDEPLHGSIDLRHATVTMGRYLNEGAVVGAGELVNHPSGEDATPTTLHLVRATGPDAAVFRTPHGELPSVLAALWVHGGALHGSIQVSGASLDDPQACAPGAGTTFLGTHVVVSDGVNHPVQVLSAAPWRCVRDQAGAVRSLELGRVR